MLAGPTPHQELIKLIETVHARLDGDLIQVDKNMVLNHPEGDFVRVLFSSVHAEHGKNAAAGHASDVLTI